MDFPTRLSGFLRVSDHTALDIHAKTQIRTYVKVEESKQLKMEIQIGSEFTDTSTVAYYYVSLHFDKFS